MASTMAVVSASASSLLHKPLATSPLVASRSGLIAGHLIGGLPRLRKVKVTCSSKEEKVVAISKLALPSFATLIVSHPALALVDERLSTEGTGLGLGISNPVLIWIILGVAALVWSLYFTYSSSLPDGDDDSGLAL